MFYVIICTFDNFFCLIPSCVNDEKYGSPINASHLWWIFENNYPKNDINMKHVITIFLIYNIAYICHFHLVIMCIACHNLLPFAIILFFVTQSTIIHDYKLLFSRLSFFVLFIIKNIMNLEWWTLLIKNYHECFPSLR